MFVWCVKLITTVTNRVQDNSAQRQVGPGQLGPEKKSAQDNSAQVVPISEDSSAQIAEDHSAHKNQTRHLLMY